MSLWQLGVDRKLYVYIYGIGGGGVLFHVHLMMSGVVRMQEDKIKVSLSGVSETLLFCLWGLAQVSKRYRSLSNDEKAIELVEKIDYDFSTSAIPFEDILSNISLEGGLPLLSLFTSRAKQFDDKAKAYIAEHRRASVVNIGAGLDTTFYRVDNGLMHWHDLDLPAVIDVRK